MPTVIDSLVVLLKLDPSQFTEGQKQAAQDLGKFTDQMGAAFNKQAEGQKRHSADEIRQNKDRLVQNKQVAESYKFITDKVIGWATALISAGAIVDFAKNTAQMDNSLGRFAERLDLNKDQLALWVSMLNNVTGSTATSVKSVQQSADALNSVRFAISIGDVSKQGIIQALGLSQADLQDPLQSLEKIHQHINAMHMSSRTATPLLRQLGIDDQTISVLERGSNEYDNWMESAKRSVPATREQMDAAEDATRAMGEFDAAITGLVNDIEGKLLPSFTHVVTGAAAMAEQTQGPMQHIESEVEGLIGAFARLGQSTKGDGSLNLFGRAAIAIFGGIHVALMSLGALIYGVINNLTTLANAAGAAASGDWSGAGAALAAGAAKQKSDGAGYAAQIKDYETRLWSVITTGQMPGSPGAAPAPAGGQGGGGAGGGGSGPGTPVGGAGKMGNFGAQAAAFFQSHGASAAVAQGIGAGVTAEGGGLGMAADGAFGIGQWRGDRRRALFRFAGSSHPTLQQQLDFMLSELSGSEGAAGKAIFGAGSAAGAARAYIARYMRPGAGTQGDFNRAGRVLGQNLGSAGGAGGAGGGDHSVHIGQLVVNTKATDAKGIAADLPAALTAQASRGLF
jgi:hypothetical protein